WRRSASVSNRGCGWKWPARDSRSHRWGGCMKWANPERKRRGGSALSANTPSLTPRVRQDRLLREHRDRAGFAQEDQVAGAVVLEHFDAVLLGFVEVLLAALAGAEGHRALPRHPLRVLRE